MSDDNHKSFTDKRLSVDLLLTIVLILSIAAASYINSLDKKITVLEETVGYLQDHDDEMQKLKRDLFKDLLSR